VVEQHKQQITCMGCGCTWQVKSSADPEQSHMYNIRKACLANWLAALSHRLWARDMCSSQPPSVLSPAAAAEPQGTP
jgi:hypothetical protein